MKRRRKVRIPADTERRDRTQFLSLRRLQAHKHGKSYDDKQVLEHARIEWERRKEAERRRKSKTRRIDGRHLPGLEVPSFLNQLAATDAVNNVLQSIGLLFGAVLKLRFLEEREVSEVASKLGLSKQAARFTIQKALREARKVSTL